MTMVVDFVRGGVRSRDDAEDDLYPKLEQLLVSELHSFGYSQDW